MSLEILRACKDLGVACDSIDTAIAKGQLDPAMVRLLVCAVRATVKLVTDTLLAAARVSMRSHVDTMASTLSLVAAVREGRSV